MGETGVDSGVETYVVAAVYKEGFGGRHFADKGKRLIDKEMRVMGLCET